MGTSAHELPFRVTGASVHWEVGPTELAIPEMLGLKLQLGDEPLGGVSLSSGERLQDITGSLQIVPEAAATDNGGKIGRMTFRGALSANENHGDIPAFYFIRVSLPRKQFDETLALCRLGQIPTEIEVGTIGLTLPTEFAFHWDIKASPELPVTSVSFDATLMPVPQSPAPDPIVPRLEEKLETIGKILMWLGIGMLCILLVLLFRR